MITLGAVAPVFKCNSNICYSSDGMGVGKGTDLTFRQLQATINRFAGSVRFTPVTVDGFIGAGTVSALKAILEWLKLSVKWGPTGNALAAAATSKDMLAKTAPGVIGGLTDAANDLKLPAAGSTASAGGGVTVTSPVTSTSVTNMPSPPGIEDLFPSSGAVTTPATSATSAVGKALPKWPFYLGGAALAIGLGFMLFNREKTTSPVAGARWRKRY